MPELPEVETMAARMQRWVGWKIREVAVDPRMSEKAAKKYLPDAEVINVIGQEITGIYRRGKFIIFSTPKGALLCHNAMSGYWDTTLEPWTFDYVEGDRDPVQTDIRVELVVQRGSDVWTLNFHDARMFGSLRWMTPEKLAKKLSELGPDALETKCLYEPNHVMMSDVFAVTLAGTAKPVKEVLMDQGKIAGVGNIYAVEALYEVGISPHRPANQVTVRECNELHVAVRNVMSAALQRNLNYDALKVYRRKTCKKCAGPITSAKLKGRTTHWCASCQS